MNVLITGGAGFIGSHLVEFHLNRDDNVLVIDDLSTGSEDNLSSFISNPNFFFEKANLLSWTNMRSSVAQAERIYHMAAVVGFFRVLKNPVDVLAINIEATNLLLKAVQENNWKSTLIVASTSEVYGHGIPGSIGRKFSENDPLLIGENSSLRWNYSISKLVDETYALSYAKCFQAPIIAVRLFNTIGPRQTGHYGMVVPRFIQQAVRGYPITIFGDGSQKRSFCDVRDTVVILDSLANNPASFGEVVNVGNDQEISIYELAILIKRLANSDSEIRFVPYEEAYGTKFEDIMRRCPNMEKLLSLTNMSFRWTLEETLLDLIERERQIAML